MDLSPAITQAARSPTAAAAAATRVTAAVAVEDNISANCNWSVAEDLEDAEDNDNNVGGLGGPGDLGGNLDPNPDFHPGGLVNGAEFEGGGDNDNDDDSGHGSVLEFVPPSEFQVSFLLFMVMLVDAGKKSNVLQLTFDVFNVMSTHYLSVSLPHPESECLLPGKILNGSLSLSERQALLSRGRAEHEAARRRSAAFSPNVGGDKSESGLQSVGEAETSF